MVKKSGLGKGLAALIPTSAAFGQEDLPAMERDGLTLLPLSEILPNPDQPRKSFDQDKIRELADSIKSHGVLQPIVVQPKRDGFYQIVVGERRWKASLLAGLKEIPCLIKDLPAQQISELALIENIQREDLNSVEEAEGYRRLMDDHQYTQETLAERLGKSRSHIANTLRLLNLPAPILEFVRGGQITPGHARAILSLDEADQMLPLTERIIADKLSVRQTEEAARKINEGPQAEAIPPGKKHSDEAIVFRLSPGLRAIEDRLRGGLGTKVKLRSGEKGGKIEIEYYSDEELTRIVEIISPENC